MIKKCLLLFLVVCAFFGCSSSGSKHTGPQKAVHVSSDRYLTATGTGATEPEARRAAKAEMSAIFESKIESQIDSNVELVTDLVEQEDVKKQTETKVRIKTSVELQGVEIRKTWYDEKSRSFYAVAELDKLKAREQWNERLTNLQKDINAKFEKIEKTESLLLQLESLKWLFGLMNEKETLTNRLRVIGYSAPDLSEHSSGSIMEMIMEIKSRMLIHVDIKGDQAREVSGTISEQLTKKGYKLTTALNHADVLMNGTVKTEPVKLNNAEWEFSRATVSVSVRDSNSNSEVIKAHKNVRKGHINYDEASRRAAISAAKKVLEIIIVYFEI